MQDRMPKWLAIFVLATACNGVWEIFAALPGRYGAVTIGGLVIWCFGLIAALRFFAYLVSASIKILLR
jgi:hypothetical protein